MAAPIDTQVLLKNQIEYYFSTQNLARDQYLVSQMDEEKYVPVSLIANFPKVQAISTDISVVKAAIKKSKSLELDASEEKLRARAPVRTTLVLRDVVAGTTEEQIRAVVGQVTDGSNIVKVQADIANTWFVEFVDEETCVKVSLVLPAMTLNEKPIYCGIKATSQYSFYIYPSVPSRVEDKKRKPNQMKKRKDEKAPLGIRDFPALGAAASTSVKEPVVLTLPATTSVSNTIGYTGPFTKYTREQMAAVVEKMSQCKFSAPETYKTYRQNGADGVPIVPILRATASTTTTLLEPIPVMYPASPSPQMAMAGNVSNLPPFFDLSQPLAALPTLGAPASSTLIPTLTAIPTLTSSVASLSLAPSAAIVPVDNKRQNRRPNQNGNNNGNWTGNAPRQTKPTNAQNTQNNQNRPRRKNLGLDTHAFPTGDFAANSNTQPKKVMNFASIVATQPSEDSIKKAQQAAQQIQAARQAAAKPKEEPKAAEEKPVAAEKPKAAGNKKKTENKKKESEPKTEKKEEKKVDKVEAAPKKAPVLSTPKKVEVAASSTEKLRWSDLVKH